ncbi:MAG TPA: hypothetical protein VHV77_05900 [Pirellulales bacterium]|jgi:hypothetical protein|nr:hypothetical protein [Pirellulales bacterium]
MRFHRAIATIFVVSAAGSRLCAESAEPTMADFIPAAARDYFNAAKQPQFWGAEVRGWRVGFRPTDAHVSYVEDGGLGEFVSLQVHVFTDDPIWTRWRSIETMRFNVIAKADGRPDFSTTLAVKIDTSSGQTWGYGWGFYDVKFLVGELHDRWGVLPAQFSVIVTLDEPELPSVASAIGTVSLAKVQRSNASWTERLLSLRVGQSRAEIESLLGKPIEERRWESDGKLYGGLRYFDPLAAPRYIDPVDFLMPVRPEVPKINIFLGAQDRYVGWSPGC